MTRPRRRRRRGLALSEQRIRTTALVVAILGGLLCVGTALRYLADHPAVLALGVAVALAVGSGAGWAVAASKQSARRRERELTLSIAVTDAMTGPQFEQWTAALLRRTGFSQVEVRGGSGDLGADIIARAPARQRVVVQCKCFRADRAVGSPDVQRFAGTARTVHRAEVALLITTGRVTAPAVDAARKLGIVLVDRRLLATWAADDVLPGSLSSLVADSRPA